jgi:hypothetical protein
MRRISSLVALSLIAFTSTASAQRSSSVSHSDNSNMPVELGFDAALGAQLSGGANKTTAFQAPIQQIRAGFFMSPVMTIEPVFRLTTGNVSGPNGGSFTDYGIGAGLLWHLSENRTVNQVYLRPFLGVNGSSCSGCTSTSAFSFGAGVGIKLPMANRFATRLEANLEQTQAHNAVPSRSTLNLLAGLSVYSH